MGNEEGIGESSISIFVLGLRVCVIYLIKSNKVCRVFIRGKVFVFAFRGVVAGSSCIVRCCYNTLRGLLSRVLYWRGDSFLYYLCSFGRR